MRIRSWFSAVVLASLALAPTSHAYMFVSEDFTGATRAESSATATVNGFFVDEVTASNLTFQEGLKSTQMNVVNDPILGGGSALSYNGSTMQRSSIMAILPQTITLGQNLTIGTTTQIVSKLTAEVDLRVIGTQSVATASGSAPNYGTGTNNRHFYPLGFFNHGGTAPTYNLDAPDGGSLTGNDLQNSDDFGYAIRGGLCITNNSGGFTYGLNSTTDANVGPTFWGGSPLAPKPEQTFYGQGTLIPAEGTYVQNNLGGGTTTNNATLPAANTPYVKTNDKSHLIFTLELVTDEVNHPGVTGVKLTSIFSSWAIDPITFVATPIDLNGAAEGTDITNVGIDWGGNTIAHDPFLSFNMITMGLQHPTNITYDNLWIYTNGDSSLAPTGTVPEPATLGLLGLGSLFLARRNRKAA